ncbi:MAG: RNA polymerase sigma factor [Gammaproteobacteria bacterium]|nr:RNA polymerase sigma factor [Gammaproteobacteria bacterium]MBT8444898.1 RNA polymerase sigma factor [Gammaproteobacteria bacterium]
MEYDGLGSAQEDRTLNERLAMDRFLADVERRAFRIADIAVRNADDALDIVQDSMMRFVRRYSAKPESEWPPLFFRVLRNRIIDHQRSQSVRGRVMTWFSRSGDDDREDPVARAPDPAMRNPEQQAGLDDAMSALEQAVGKLPDRQREAFLLRAMEGLDVADTATAMGCTDGSVKQHYYRAVRNLRAALGDHWS